MSGDYGYEYDTARFGGDGPDLPGGKSRMGSFSRFVFALVRLCLVVVVVAGGLALFLKSTFEAPGPLIEDTQFSVVSGQGLTAIAKGLEDAGFISSSHIFIAGVLFHDAKGKLKAGEFLLPKAASMQMVMQTLVSGRSVQHKVTIPEGMTSWQAVERLRKHPILVGEINEVPPEGGLLPDTYVFLRGVSREQLIERMRKAQQKAIDALWENRKAGLPVKTKQEAIILASIVEKETAKADERARVAAVFVNRLRKGMRLQSDPTIIYGIVGGKGLLGRSILKSDISRKTAYNTYKIKALPPTPIANPGFAAIEAVLNPLETDDLYFVADGTGGHAFATTLAGHNRNVGKWRKIEAKRRSLAASKAALARKESSDQEKREDQAEAARAANSSDADAPLKFAREIENSVLPPEPPAPPSFDPAPVVESTSEVQESNTAARAPDSSSGSQTLLPQDLVISENEAGTLPAAVAPEAQAAVMPDAATEPDPVNQQSLKGLRVPIPRPKPVRRQDEPIAAAEPGLDSDEALESISGQSVAPDPIEPPARKKDTTVKSKSQPSFSVNEPDR